jgi:hypothetical protein
MAVAAADAAASVLKVRAVTSTAHELHSAADRFAEGGTTDLSLDLYALLEHLTHSTCSACRRRTI